jgi:hypothetical protein
MDPSTCSLTTRSRGLPADMLRRPRHVTPLTPAFFGLGIDKDSVTCPRVLTVLAGGFGESG